MISVDKFDNYEEYLEFRENLVENNNRPFVDNRVEWHSDDFYYDVASVLMIEKKEDSYKVIFSQSRDKDNFVTYLVRFRNSRSRYSPYNFFLWKCIINYVYAI